MLYAYLCLYLYMIRICLKMEDLPRQSVFLMGKNNQHSFCSLSSNKAALSIGMGWRVELTQLLVAETCPVT